MSTPTQIYMPWGEPEAAPVTDVQAVLANVPKAANHCTPARAADVFGCTTRSVYNMIESGLLLAEMANTSPTIKRKHYRIIVRLERPYDPGRKTFLTLEEAARARSNIDGLDHTTMQNA